MNRKTNDIHLWKIFFTYVIAFFHFDKLYYVSAYISEKSHVGWYIAVDFFFMVSGYLLYIKKDSYESSLHFLSNRLKKIYPVYLTAMLLTFVTILISKGEHVSFGTIRMYFVEYFPEIFMLQGFNLGRGWNYINPISWYIPEYLLVGMIIIFLIKRDEKTFFCFISPVATIVAFSILYFYRGDMDISIAYKVENHPLINLPFLRGALDMSLGVYSAKVTPIFIEKFKNRKCLLTVKVLSIVSIFLVMLDSFFFGYTRADYAYLFFLAIGVLGGFLPWKICESENEVNGCRGTRIIKLLSDSTLYIYLFHNMFREYIFPKIIPPQITVTLGIKLGVLLLYFAVITGIALLYGFIEKTIRDKVGRKVKCS